MKATIGVSILILLLACSTASAGPPKGFHEGPYMLLGGGLLNFSADNNVRTSTKVGRDYEPAVGFHFGWNLKDWFAPELQVRYATNAAGGNREHIVDVNLNAVYYLVIDQMTNMRALKILPFAELGPMVRLAAVPGDPASTDQKMAVWGPGAGLGAGVRLLFYRYGYASILAQSDFVHLTSKSQEIGGILTKITSGGWDLQLGLTAAVGVHF